MKLSVVIPFMNQTDLTRAVIEQLLKITSADVTDIVLIKNGGRPSPPFIVPAHHNIRDIKVIEYDSSIGVYPTFNAGFINTIGDVVAFFHSDLAIWENCWDKRVMEEFKRNKKLGMVGFIGSNEIDQAGGRGGGTTSNFKGFILDYPHSGALAERKEWRGSKAEIHGKQSEGVSKAAVVDGCAMIIRREAWYDIGYRSNFPLHHFYDRLISTQMLERKWQIEVMGVACDHFSGQTVNQEPLYHALAEHWCKDNVAETWWAKEGDKINWDLTMYQEAERRWLAEYRNKGFVPYRVS